MSLTNHSTAVVSAMPIIVLHRPQIGENIGMSARAMANCGLQQLRLSQPRPEWDITKARAAATCGAHLIDTHQHYADLKAAVADCHTVYATTARPRDMPLKVITPEQAATEIAAMAVDQQVAIVFGAEASGLSNDDLSLAQAVIEIPLCPGYTSLNLSQAVLICAYHCWRNRATAEPIDDLRGDLASSATPPRATKADVDYFLRRLHTALEPSGFFRDAKLAAVTWRNIQTMIHRADFHHQDIQTWHGILSALQRPSKSKNT